MKVKVILVGIIFLAIFLRLPFLDQYPAGFNADEASIGYNAYSIIKTGRDEYGNLFPLQFKSFGDYKPGLYFYLVAPFVATLGLNEWAVRLPSALLGIASVLLIYFLAREIFQKEIVGLLAGALLAISPWHIHFSRGGWETNVATFFMTLGIYLFVRSFKTPLLMLLSGIAFLLSMYTYQSPRLVIPVVVLFLILFYRRELKSTLFNIKLKVKLTAILILFILALPLILQFQSPAGAARFQGLSFLSDIGPMLRVNELRGEHQTLSGVFARLVHNKLTAYTPNFLGHYLDHFRPDFLFIRGDPLIRNKIPDVGQFYVIESLFVIFGIVALVRNNFARSKLLLIWILVAPLASSVTFQTPHALRAHNMVIPLTLVIAYGMYAMIQSLKNYGRVLLVGLIALVILFETAHYLESYYIHYPKRYPLAWEYGFAEMVNKLVKYESDYKKVVITDRYDQPYILVLFYKKYDPKLYQPQAKLTPRDKFNFGTIRSFDKYQFRKIDPKEIAGSPDTLFIGTSEEIPQNATILNKVFFPNSQAAFVFAKGGK